MGECGALFRVVGANNQYRSCQRYRRLTTVKKGESWRSYKTEAETICSGKVQLGQLIHGGRKAGITFIEASL